MGLKMYTSLLANKLLELMPDALVVIDEQQRIVHFNPQAERLFQEPASDILGQPLDVLLPPELTFKHYHHVQNFLHSREQLKRPEESNVLSARRKNGENFSFLGTISKLHLPEGIRLAIIMHEVTDYLRSEHLRQRQERALYCLSQCLSAVIQAEEEARLFQEICQIVVRTGGYPFAWVGFAQNDEQKAVRPMAFAGQDGGYLQEVFVSWAEDDPSGSGPIGRAIRTGRPQFSRNTAIDKEFAPWREPALQRGFFSVVAFPLHIDSHVLGTLTLYSQDDFFDHEEVKLLSTLADNLSFGLNALRIRKERDEKESLLHRSANQLQERIKDSTFGAKDRFLATLN
jgi:PAS domain S-box-containing protein